MAVLLGFACSLVLPLFFSANAAAQDVGCLENLPQPSPIAPSHRVVQLVDCLPPRRCWALPMQPDRMLGTWFQFCRERKPTVMAPFGAPNNANVLTIDLPPEWENTKKEGSVAPNIWARTGCRYDTTQDVAQCETGGAGGVYDISKAKLGPPGAVTITEWTFYQGPPYHLDNFDISAVNGASLTVDIEAVGGDAQDPQDPRDIFWWNQNAPLSVHGEDLRADNRCPDPAFRLKRSDLTSGVYGYVIVGDDGKPLGGDGTVSCFSNCGKYKFPLEPPMNCDPKTDSRCYRWKTFCAGDPTQYGMSCATDNDCPVNGACWVNPGSPLDHTCQLRAFINAPTCDPAVCTFPYGYINPYTHLPDYSTQPPFGRCVDVARKDPGHDPRGCIGDDTVHTVFPNAYTWPNDPEVFGSDAPLYRVTFAPGGTKVPITQSVDKLPLCKELPGIYCYNEARNYCAGDIKNGSKFAIARWKGQWSCVFAGAGNDGVICGWGDAGAGPEPCQKQSE